MPVTVKALLAKDLRLSRATEAIRLISEGAALAVALRETGLAQQAFHETLSTERELAVRYARAQEIRADRLADEVVQIADNAEIPPDRARNMIQARQWRAKTLNPKTYGERIDLNVTQTIDVLGTLTDARARLLRPVSDQQPDVIDVTPIEPMSCGAQPTDDQSVPDIFS